MSNTGSTVQVTLTLPKDLYERAAQTAASEKRELDELLSSLVAEGVDRHRTVRDVFEQISTQYRTRLDQEGKLLQSSEEVLQELRTLREQIAREFYP